MKAQNTLIEKWFILPLLVIVLACSKNDAETGMDPGTGTLQLLPGLSEDDFEVYDGEIGVIIDARELARKGYLPTKAEVEVNATTGNFDKIVTIDPLLNSASLSYIVDELSENAVEELTAGVDISVKILGENDQVLAVQDISKISFTSASEELEINANALVDNFAAINLREEVGYHIQLVAADNSVEDISGAPHSILHSSGVPWTNGSPITLASLENLDYSNINDIQNFYSYFFEKVEGEPDTYTIFAKNASDTTRKHYLYMNGDDRYLCIQNGWNWIRNNGNTTDASSRQNYKFRIEKVGIGLYTISPATSGKALKLTNETTQRQDPNGVVDIPFSGLKGNDDVSNDPPIYFRILSLDIDWDIQRLESKFLTPILPPASMSFAYNSTLVNCSSGALTQEVGIERTEASTVTASWSESMTISTRKTYEISLSLEAEVSAKFRGFGGSVKRTLTGTYNVSKEVSKTRSVAEALTTSELVTLSSKRSQTVEPGKATLISDNYQFYSDIQIPFVQRYRIKGTYQEDGQPLSGAEISTQFGFNEFTGVISAVGQDFIEVTVRGTTTFDRLIDTETQANDVPANCN